MNNLLNLLILAYMVQVGTINSIQDTGDVVRFWVKTDTVDGTFSIRDNLDIRYYPLD